MNSIRDKNLKTIQSVVNEIRDNTKNSQSNGIQSLFYKPENRNPFAKRDIEFISNENQNNSEQLLSNIYTMHVPIDNKSQQLVPVINFDINFNKPLIEILEQDYSGYVQKIRNFQSNINTIYKSLTEHSIHNKEDKIMKNDYLNGYKNAESNINQIITNRPTFKQEDEKHLLTFVIGHELAHLSFTERNYVRWDLMDGMKNKMSLQEMNDLSSVIYSLNRGTNWKSQHNGANYLSTRDEIHSDIAGLFLMTYLAMKNGEYNDTQFNHMFRNIGKMRTINNIANDLNGASTHNSNLVFQQSNFLAIKKLAQEQIANPNKPIDLEILKLTENIFFQTLKQDGIILKPTNQNLQVSSELQKTIQTSPEKFDVAYIYEGLTHIRNEKSSLDFQTCLKDVVEAYKNNCQALLQGNQLRAIDPDGDKIINFKNVDEANISKGKSLGLTGKEVENKQIHNEAIIFSNFTKQNSINVRSENSYGDDTIDLSQKKLRFDYLK